MVASKERFGQEAFSSSIYHDWQLKKPTRPRKTSATVHVFPPFPPFLNSIVNACLTNRICVRKHDMTVATMRAVLFYSIRSFPGSTEPRALDPWPNAADISRHVMLAAVSRTATTVAVLCLCRCCMQFKRFTRASSERKGDRTSFLGQENVLRGKYI